MEHKKGGEVKKAKEYFQEIKPLLDSNDFAGIKIKASEIIKEMVSEDIPFLAEQRGIRTQSALSAIEEQVNRKWNSLCDKCELYGKNVLKKDAVKRLCEEVWDKI